MGCFLLLYHHAIYLPSWHPLVSLLISELVAIAAQGRRESIDSEELLLDVQHVQHPRGLRGELRAQLELQHARLQYVLPMGPHLPHFPGIYQYTATRILNILAQQERSTNGKKLVYSRNLSRCGALC